MLHLSQFLALLKIFFAPRSEIILENIASQEAYDFEIAGLSEEKIES